MLLFCQVPRRKVSIRELFSLKANDADGSTQLELVLKWSRFPPPTLNTEAHLICSVINSALQRFNVCFSSVLMLDREHVSLLKF